MTKDDALRMMVDTAIKLYPTIHAHVHSDPENVRGWEKLGVNTNMAIACDCAGMARNLIIASHCTLYGIDLALDGDVPDLLETIVGADA